MPIGVQADFINMAPCIGAWIEIGHGYSAMIGKVLSHLI
ncbi:Hypothetical protein NF53_p5045 (plasmid) [Bacillus thuringiensis serovar indiana]|nr:Hypothetical protein NF53_p5045 [Bacillus thuringiensis serovar indiana]